MGTMGDSMGSMGGSMGSMDGYMGTMDGYMGTMGRTDDENKTQAAQKAADNAFITLQQLRDMITEIRSGEYGSIAEAEAALRKFLGGVGDAAKGHLGKAIKDFVLKGAEVPLEGAGIGIRSVLLAFAGAGYGVEKIARGAHKAVSDTIKN